MFSKTKQNQVAKKSTLIKTLLEDALVCFIQSFPLISRFSRIRMPFQHFDQVTEDDSEPIPLPNVSSGTLDIILTWIDLHQVQSCKNMKLTSLILESESYFTLNNEMLR